MAIFKLYWIVQKNENSVIINLHVAQKLYDFCVGE